MDGSEHFDYHDARLNAERKVAWRLVDEHVFGGYVNRDTRRDPTRKRYPRSRKPEFYDYPSCKFMRAVVYGPEAVRIGRGTW